MIHSFNVGGMTCGHCEKSVTRAINEIDPGADVKIDRQSGKVDILSQQSREILVKAIADQGYEVA